MGCFKKSETAEDEEVSRKPSDSPFKQQKMKAWQPVLTASTVLPIFFFIGVVFVPIGIALLVTSNNIKEVVIEYSDHADCKACVDAKSDIKQNCNCSVDFTLDTTWEGDVYFYYGLSNFYQNHRRYVRSRDDEQLNGKLTKPVNSNCAPFAKDNSSNYYLPCGAIANSMFNDTFNIKLNKVHTVPMTDKNIAWRSDVETKFQNPKNLNSFDNYIKPRGWRQNITELPDHLQNQDFIVWMRVAAFPTFRKLYRKLNYHAQGIKKTPFSNSLPNGKYTLYIDYNFPVSKFDGKKRFILTTSSWIGGKNPFLGTCYIVIGCLCLAFGFLFLIIHMKRTKLTSSSR